MAHRRHTPSELDTSQSAAGRSTKLWRIGVLREQRGPLPLSRRRLGPGNGPPVEEPQETARQHELLHRFHRIHEGAVGVAFGIAEAPERAFKKEAQGLLLRWALGRIGERPVLLVERDLHELRAMVALIEVRGPSDFHFDDFEGAKHGPAKLARQKVRMDIPAEL